MSEDVEKDEDHLLNGLSPEFREKVLYHLGRINKTFPSEDSPLSDLVSLYRKSVETINRIPSLLTDKLTDRFRMSKDIYAQQFQQDVNFLIKAGDLRELKESEIRVLAQAAKDSMEAMFSALLDTMSKVLNDYLRWAPSAVGTSSGDDVDVRALKMVKSLKLQFALAKAEADVCREEMNSLKEAVMPKVSGRYKILEVLENSNKPMRVTEIAVELGFAEVTVRRYMKALEREGLVERVGSGKPHRYVLRDKNWRRNLAIEQQKRKQSN